MMCLPNLRLGFKMKLLLPLLVLCSYLLATDVYIIASEPITTSKEELQNFFFAKSNYLNGKKYQRVNNKEAIGLFANRAFSISKRKLSKKWIKQNFRKGIPFPVSIRNNKKTIDWIQTHPDSVGFITQKSDALNIIYTYSE